MFFKIFVLNDSLNGLLTNLLNDFLNDFRTGLAQRAQPTQPALNNQHNQHSQASVLDYTLSKRHVICPSQEQTGLQQDMTAQLALQPTAESMQDSLQRPRLRKVGGAPQQPTFFCIVSLFSSRSFVLTPMSLWRTNARCFSSISHLQSPLRVIAAVSRASSGACRYGRCPAQK